MENIPIGLSTAFGLFTLHGMKGYQRRERAACIVQSYVVMTNDVSQALPAVMDNESMSTSEEQKKHFFVMAAFPYLFWVSSTSAQVNRWNPCQENKEQRSGSLLKQGSELLQLKLLVGCLFHFSGTV